MTMACSLFLLSLLSVCVLARGEGRLDLLLHSYHNPTHQLHSGVCCDSPSTTSCQLDPCDNVLTLCLLPHTPTLTDSSPSYLREGLYRSFRCPYQWRRVDLGLLSVNSDDIVFPAEGGWINRRRGVRNPLTLTGDDWENGFKLLVLVADFDLKRRELVSVLVGDWGEMTPGNNFSRSQVVRSVGGGNVTLTVSARVMSEKEPILAEESSRSQSGKDKSSTRSHPPPTQPSEPTSTPSHPPPSEPATTPSTTTPTGWPTTPQLDPNEDTPAVDGGPVIGDTNKALEVVPGSRSNVRGGGSVGAGVGGAIAASLVVVVTILVALMCVGCYKKRRRDDQTRLTGSAESEVTALRSGPTDNPNYTGVLPDSHTSSGSHPSYGFSNSLYGALSQDSQSQAGSHDSYVTSSRSLKPIDSQYSMVTREHMEGGGVEDSGSYSAVRGEGPVPAGYSVITRENMEEEEGYSVITRENMTNDGYSVVRREHLEEAADSGSEGEQNESHDLDTSKLLSSEQSH